MSDNNPVKQFLSNSRPYLEGVKFGIDFANDSALRTHEVVASSHPCFAYALIVEDADADEADTQSFSNGDPVSMSASAFRLFYSFNQQLPDGAYFDDCLFKQNGSVITNIVPDKIPQSATITIEYGFVYDKQGNEIGRVQDAARAWLARHQDPS